MSPAMPGAMPVGGVPPPVSIDLSELSERSKEKVELQQKLQAVQARVHADESAPSPPMEHSSVWEELQSAHAHMLLLEARLAELGAEAPTGEASTPAGVA